MRVSLLVIAAVVGGCHPPPRAPATPPPHAAPAPAPATRQAVLLVTHDNLYLEGAMQLCDHIDTSKVTPEEYAAAPDRLLASVQVVVFDDYTPDEVPPPPVNAIYFHPNGPASPIPVDRTLYQPLHITAIAEDHPVMQGVTLADASFDSTNVLAPRAGQGELSLASIGSDPVIAARVEGGRKILVFGFSLVSTDLVLRAAYVRLVSNALDWFAGRESAGRTCGS